MPTTRGINFFDADPNLAFTLALVALSVVAWRRFGAPYGAYALTSLALPLSAPSDKLALLSMTRFGLVVFPAVMALAAAGARRWVHVAIVIVFAAWLGVLVVKWALWQWVA